MPQATYLRPDFETYEDVSSDIMSFLRKYADKFEQASIDEAYMDVTQICAVYGGPIELAKRIKREMKELFNLTCSIGIAPNKSAAKIASDMQKPNGLTFIDEAHIRDVLAPLPVSKISGIGSKTESSLREIGIITIGDLAKSSPKLLHTKFGKSAVWLWAIANAEERVEVEENFMMRSIGAEHTFEEDTVDWSIIDHELTALSENVYKRLSDERMAFRTVVLKIRFRGFETHTRNKSLKFSTTKKSVILDTLRELCAEFRPAKKEIRLVGVRVSGLESKPPATIDSFTK